VESTHRNCSVKVALVKLYGAKGETLSPRLEEVTYQKLRITYQFCSWRALFSPLLYRLSYLGVGFIIVCRSAKINMGILVNTFTSSLANKSLLGFFLPLFT
jgi:hypothetical protein